MSQSADVCQKVKIGSEVGLSFALPPVLDSPYGSADKLHGVIPFLLPYGEYVIPSIFQDMDRLTAFANQKAIEYRDCFPNQLDETIRKRIKESTVFGSFLYPNRDVTEEGMRSYAIISCLAFALDDFIDDVNFDFGFKYAESKPAMKLFEDILCGVYERIEDVPSPIEALAPIKKIFWDLREAGSKEIKHWKGNYTHVLYEYRNSIASTILLREQGLHSQFSDDVKRMMRGYLDAALVIAEFVIFHQNIQVSEEIRNDMLFQQMRNAYVAASCTINEVCGICRDIENEHVQDSGILTKVVTTGIPLQTGFDNALTNLNGYLKDFKIAAKLLREFYYDDPNVSKYIRCMEHGFDGMMYAYLRTPRYLGKANPRIVPID